MFSFGGASKPAFGAASTPAFGSSSAPAFGASPATGSGFGAATSTPAFGGTSTPGFGFGAPSTGAFGAASSSPGGLFGAASASAFGAGSAPAFGAGGFGASSPATGGAFSFAGGTSPGLFGASPFGAAPAAASSPSPFGAALGGSPFGAASTPAMGASPFGGQPGQQHGLIAYSTRFDDLPADKQKELQDIQREIGSYREDCEKLERDQRLHDSLSMKKGMEEETSALQQSLQGMLNSIRADDDALADFREKVLKLLRSTEYAVRTFERAKLWRDAPQMYKGQIVPTQVQELLASPVVLPSPYLEQAVQGFQQTLENYRTVIGELEQALPADIMDRFGVGDDVSVAQALPLVISHMHDFFVHVAARMDKLHQEVQKCKDNFMTQRKAEGQFSDPFEDSRRYIQSHMTPGGTVKTGGTPGSTGKAGFGSQHAYRGAGMPGTPAGTPFNAVGGYTPGAAPTPFGTPFGGALSPAYDMSRNPMAATGRRRR
uniref:Nucleoporin Nup54 alpha-helical domain-containing protein n=1 Tax=Chlamydomonas euryale TaxID=1486919 RepID=A0A7R9Z5P3_9CHLO|mmetsp:Transcript_44496/g.133061  ORF Transcript_44496/g.133061 Transcript_44496/m.133061 type:complete len:488 (+) Transcript_44496:159-1622(+)